MQGELSSEYPDKPITIIGVNEVGHESGNALMSEGRSVALLQDVDANNNGVSDVWYDQWDITYRDVRILNQENELVGAVNLTPPAGFDLSENANYEALKQILVDVAHEQAFWQNPDDPLDVNRDQEIDPQDALQVINELNLRRISDSDSSTLPLPMRQRPTPYVDVNGDGMATPIDALRVINRLIEQSRQGEGEWIGEQEDALQSVLPTPDEQTSTDDDSIEGEHGAPAVEMETMPIVPIDRPASQADTDYGTSAPLSSDAVDSIFEAADDPLIADPIVDSLLSQQSGSDAVAL